MTQAPARRVPPGPPMSAAPRLLWKLARDRLGLMTEAARTYGDVARITLGPKTLFFFNHPDHAKHVLVDNAPNFHKGLGLAQARRVLGDGLLTSEGELWRAQRTRMQPVFRPKRLAEQAGAVAQEAGRLTGRLRRAVGGEPVDVVAEMTSMTLGVLGRTLLDTDLRAFTGLGRLFEVMQNQAMFEAVSNGMVPLWVPLPQQIRFRRAQRDLQLVVDRLVSERARRPLGDDALSRLMVAVREDPDPRTARQRMRDELTTLLLAGHETTASTLGWAFYLVDRHPEVRERLRAEAVEVLGDRAPVYEDLHRLRYTVMVLNEVMRLYPPVWMLSRVPQHEDVIGGYHVPAGVDVLICPYTLHRHPAYWPDPDAFRPERFDPAATPDRPRHAYLPFGAGPRFCVGNNLGMMEATFVLAMVSRELELSVLPGRAVVPEPMLSLRVRGGLPMTVTKARHP
ncbi:cytochrome P450 [Actinoplanes siamensis]|uniref:Cytochrome P450 n=1 Tax=Actinoplanes siamensis TaxID=1223317 RepID=A0A919NCN6_9ACTN|nr:cytochrome P450 [Actinoplanes siamensis]GIF08493.1 cytochrome P450 [Actinoplanes siamensis]